MPSPTLSKDERDIERAIEKHTRTPLSKKTQTALALVAKNTHAGSKQISIRVNEQDLHKLRAKAMRSGVPYQTLINQLIHQHVS